MNKLAVIMSVYINDKIEYVRQAIESLIYQTFDAFDIFIIFDGPVSKEVKLYIDDLSDSRVKVLKRDNNRGLAYSLNELLSLVLSQKYEYIARMDADDISMPDRFEKQLAYLHSHPEVECLGTWAIEINSKGEEYYRKQMPETHEECNNMFRKRDCMIHPTVMYRRSYIEKAGFYSLDTYFGEDTMMWAQGFKAGCVFANVPEYLLLFRLDENFFERRRGWKHAKSIFTLRHRVNKMLNYGIIADFWAFAYAAAKMMPKFILNIIYKTAR